MPWTDLGLVSCIFCVILIARTIKINGVNSLHLDTKIVPRIEHLAKCYFDILSLSSAKDGLVFI